MRLTSNTVAFVAWSVATDLRAQQAVPIPTLPTPTITRRELLSALELEISKIRIAGVPANKQFSIELTEWGPGIEPRTRSLGHLTFSPATDWIECLISAHMENSGCRRINIELHHESAISWKWPIDMERRFGTGARALPLDKRDGFLNFDSQVLAFKEGTSMQIAEFRVPSRRRYYVVTLNTYKL